VIANNSIVSVHELTTTALLQNPRSNAKPKPAEIPATRETRSSGETNLPILETITAINPLEIAAATADPTASRQAMFPNGNNLIHAQPQMAQIGCPEGVEGPGYIAAVANTPEYPNVTCGAKVVPYTNGAIQPVTANTNRFVDGDLLTTFRFKDTARCANH
jgi:hypothetical protein